MRNLRNSLSRKLWGEKETPLFFKVLIGFTVGLIAGQVVGTYPSLAILLRITNTFASLFNNYMSFFVPLLIIGLIAPEIIELGSNARRLLGLTLVIIYISMLLSGLFAYFAAFAVIPYFADLVLDYSSQASNTFLPTNFKIAPVFGLVSALVLAFTLGLAGSVTKVPSMQSFLNDLRKIIMRVLHSFIVPLLPFYIAAVFAKISAEGTLLNNIIQYSTLIGSIVVLQITALLVLYSVTSVITKRSLPVVISRVLPLYLTGLSTQSSTASIPVSLFASERLEVSEHTRNFVTPIAATMHMVGSVIAQTFGVIMVYRIFYGEVLDFSTALLLINFLIIVLIATPGVPGGAPAATVPVFKEMLGFNAEASAIMYLVGITNDAFSTAANISTDPAIAMLVDKKIQSEKDSHTTTSSKELPCQE